MNLNDHFEESKKEFQFFSDSLLLRSNDISNNYSNSNLLLSRRLDFKPKIVFDLSNPMNFSLMMNPVTKVSEISKHGSTLENNEKNTPVLLTNRQNLRSSFLEKHVQKSDRFQEKVKDSFQDKRKISPYLSSSQKTKTVFCSNKNVVCSSRRSGNNYTTTLKTPCISPRQKNVSSIRILEMKILTRRNLPSFHIVSEKESFFMTPNSIHDCFDSSKRSYSLSPRVKVPIRMFSLDYRKLAKSEISRSIFTNKASKSFSSLNFRNKHTETKRVSPHRNSSKPLLSSLNTNKYVFETPPKHKKSKEKNLNINPKKLHFCNIIAPLSNNATSFNMKSDFVDQALQFRFEKNNRSSFPISLNGATLKDFFLIGNPRSLNDNKVFFKKSKNNLDNPSCFEQKSNPILINKSNDISDVYCNRKKSFDSVSFDLSKRLQSFFTHSKQIFLDSFGFKIQNQEYLDSNRYTKADPPSSNSQNSFPRSKCFTDQIHQSSCFLIPCLIFLFIIKLIFPTSTNTLFELLQNTKRFFLKTLEGNEILNYKVKKYLSRSSSKVKQEQISKKVCFRSLNFRQKSVDEIQTSFSTKN